MNAHLIEYARRSKLHWRMSSANAVLLFRTSDHIHICTSKSSYNNAVKTNITNQKTSHSNAFTHNSHCAPQWKGITIENEYQTPITGHGKATQRNKNKQNDDYIEKEMETKRKEEKNKPNESINSKTGAWTNENFLFFFCILILLCFKGLFLFLFRLALHIQSYACIWCRWHCWDSRH